MSGATLRERCARSRRLVGYVAVEVTPPHIATQGDANARGVQLKPRAPARWLVPKHSHFPYWSSHILIETREHDVDAITGPEGHRADAYLDKFWQFPDRIDARPVDVTAIDPGIEDDGS